MSTHDDVASIAEFLPAETVSAWRKLAPIVPQQMYLSGGTAITVHLKHRISRDLDFFSESKFDVDELVNIISDIGDFAPTMVQDGTVNGIFESTKVQFLNASGQRLLTPPMNFGGIRVATLPDLMATKLKVIQDRGALRDYFDIMIIETQAHITVEEGLSLLVEKYQPKAPASLIANVVRGLGYMGDVEDDPSLPETRASIESYWQNRQPQLLRSLG